MGKVDTLIISVNNVICGNIEKFDNSERGLLSQNILAQLRNLVEHTSLKVYSDGFNLDVTWENIQQANHHVKTRGDLKFLSQFHKLLQITTSHYTLDAENSERLMLKYYEYLLKIKLLLKNEYSLDVLENIDDFPIHTDPALKEYHEKIVKEINSPAYLRAKSSYNDRYYVQKTKPFFVGDEIYYEVTFTVANDKTSKFDRIIAFTKCDISPYYAVKLSVSNSSIEILGKKMPIQIIEQWEVSIRPCEIDNFAKIFGSHPKIGGTVEIQELMRYLTRTGLNLTVIIDFPDNYYSHIKQQITGNAKATHFFKILDICRDLTKKNMPGRNIIRYLLYRLNNKILKAQYHHETCEGLSGMYLKWGCKPFDDMPFNTSLIGHNPKLSDLYDCIDPSDREHELFARHIKNNTEQKGQLYSLEKDITSFVDTDALVTKYNDLLYCIHKERRSIGKHIGHLYITEYESSTVDIIKKLKELTLNGIGGYLNSVNSWLQSSSYNIDCGEKRDALKTLFENSKIALIYGSAGTGKSTMINHISNFFNDGNKLYLANTNPAVDNLKRKVNAANCTFKTIAGFLLNRSTETSYDLLIIDECSTVSNSDMLDVLNKATFKSLILVGDIFQIESILFGNWFFAAKDFVPSSAVFELKQPYRSNNQNLLTLWYKVRNIDQDILEHITRNGYSANLNESIFERSEEDEIILCLNYDGLYGINNINKFLQSSNSNDAVEWGIQAYKIDDPILFNESNRFAPLIYNNLKGKIVGIQKLEDKIQFDIEIDMAINEFQAAGYDFSLLENNANSNSVIRFVVNKYKSTDDDDDDSSDAVVPFQIAYAVSIHKAQGLEYSSVKIVIIDEIEEMITHNIFYTAITRAKERLKIYWMPETENKILSRLEQRFNYKDVALLKAKFDL